MGVIELHYEFYQKLRYLLKKYTKNKLLFLNIEIKPNRVIIWDINLFFSTD